MKVWEHVYFELNFGVENDLVKRIEVKSEEQLLAVFGVSVLRRSFLQLYKLGKKIEDLEEKEKKELWEFVKLKFPGKGKTELVENCKILYSVSKFI